MKKSKLLAIAFIVGTATLFASEVDKPDVPKNEIRDSHYTIPHMGWNQLINSNNCNWSNFYMYIILNECSDQAYLSENIPTKCRRMHYRYRKHFQEL